MPIHLTQEERAARNKALRTAKGNVPAATELLAKAGRKVDYEALSAYSRRYRSEWEEDPATHTEVLRRIVRECDTVGKDPGPVALASAIGRVRTLAAEALG